MANDVYTPEVIVENPFPGEPVLIDSSSKVSSDGNYSPTVTRPKPFKRKVLANELLSTALNTRSRKILGEFSFAASGALQLGDFREGISGDLRLTPNGITARDLAGLTTFALDGTDGSAVFKGHVQAGSFVSGSDNGVTVGPEIGVNGADFTDIQEAINFINDLGGGRVFIQAGIYDVLDTIVLYDNIELVGAGPGLTILDFSSVPNKNIQITGMQRTPTSTTVSLSQNSRTFTGTGTNYLSTVQSGDWIRLYSDVWYKISSVDSDTQLTLVDIYRGPAISNSDAFIAKLVENVTIRDLTIQGCNGASVQTASGMYLVLVGFLKIDNVISRSNDKYGIQLTNIWQGAIINTQVINNGLSGILDSNVVGVIYNGCNAQGNTNHGFLLQSVSNTSASITNCDAIQNGDHGFFLNFAANASLFGCNSYENQDDGVHFKGTSKCKMSLCHVNNNGGYGVNIEGGAQPGVKSIVIGNTFSGNDLGDTNDLGTSTIIDHNQT